MGVCDPAVTSIWEDLFACGGRGMCGGRRSKSLNQLQFNKAPKHHACEKLITYVQGHVAMFLFGAFVIASCIKFAFVLDHHPSMLPTERPVETRIRKYATIAMFALNALLLPAKAVVLGVAHYRLQTEGKKLEEWMNDGSRNVGWLSFLLIAAWSGVNLVFCAHCLYAPPPHTRHRRHRHHQ